MDPLSECREGYRRVRQMFLSLLVADVVPSDVIFRHLLRDVATFRSAIAAERGRIKSLAADLRWLECDCCDASDRLENVKYSCIENGMIRDRDVLRRAAHAGAWFENAEKAWAMVFARLKFARANCYSLMCEYNDFVDVLNPVLIANGLTALEREHEVLECASVLEQCRYFDSGYDWTVVDDFRDSALVCAVRGHVLLEEQLPLCPAKASREIRSKREMVRHIRTCRHGLEQQESLLYGSLSAALQAFGDAADLFKLQRNALAVPLDLAIHRHELRVKVCLLLWEWSRMCAQCKFARQYEDRCTVALNEWIALASARGQDDCNGELFVVSALCDGGIERECGVQCHVRWLPDEQFYAMLRGGV